MADTPVRDQTPLLTPTARASLRAISLLIAALLLTAGSRGTTAAPWIDVGDERTRHHLQNLVDSGAINLPVNTWPLMWSTVKTELDPLKASALNESQQWSYLYLKHELRMATSRVSYGKHLHFGNAPATIGNFANDARENQELTLSLSFQGHRLAYQLSPSYVADAIDGKKYRLDGSYASYLLGNWAVGVGALDRWWGPGWESSMVLSHSARPPPAIFVQRNQASAFTTPWLSWFGPWQLTTFMGQLESNRAVENPYLWGLRINIRPLRSLEIGLSRTAIWGGEGRPNDFDAFTHVLLDRDDWIETEMDQLGLSEAADQRTGVDFRWNLSTGRTTYALYGQLVGEDETDSPTKYIGMAGAEFSTLIADVSARFSIESQNSTASFYDPEKEAHNVAYEDAVYGSGYRYRGRPLGAFTDNDTEATTLRAQLFFRNGNSVKISYGMLDINGDGTGQNVFGSERLKTDKATVDFSAPISERTALKIGFYRYSKPIRFEDQQISSGATLDVFLRW